MSRLLSLSPTDFKFSFSSFVETGCFVSRKQTISFLLPAKTLYRKQRIKQTILDETPQLTLKTHVCIYKLSLRLNIDD